MAIMGTVYCWAYHMNASARGGIKLEQLQYGTGSSVGFVAIRKPWASG
jgi:hypothetical protein